MMKAEYRPKEKTENDLIQGKLYDVKEQKRKTREKWILIKNENGQWAWYRERDFILHAEADAYLKEPKAAGAGQDAAQSATPDGIGLYYGA